MTADDLRKKIWLNSISNYLRMALRMVLGLLMFRLLYPKQISPGHYAGLTPEEFGFYSALWSIIGYGILMDFGFGLAAQKKVAELSVHKDWDQLSRVLSTIFYFYFISAAIIILSVLFSSHWLIGLVKLEHIENRETFRQLLVLFLCFVGLSFPLGISIEILFGQQRIALANNLASAGAIANFALVAAAVHYGWGLGNILIITLSSSLLPSIIGGWMGLRSMPGVKLVPELFSWKVLRETMRFSAFAYVGIVTQVIMSSTDRLVIGTTISIAAITTYQLGSKVADIFYSFTLQLPETISPAAAHLHAKGDRNSLQRLLVDGTRFNVMVATPLYILCAFYMEGLMDLLTKGQVISSETFWTGQALLLWGYTTIITHSISKKIFMMCGHEKRLTRLSTIEAVANLFLSVALVLYFKNVVCVAIGSLIPSVIIGWFYLWPWAAQDAGVKGWELARQVLFRNWLAGLPLLIFAAACRFIPLLDFRHNIFIFILEGALACVVAGLSLWRWGLAGTEREKVSEKVTQRVDRFFKNTPA
jgi:O-antigen/teichoic acid export membrane protein